MFNKLSKRIRDKIKITNSCWEWTACTIRSGYGMTYFEGKNQIAHRVVYKCLVGKIPKGLQLDHLCRNRKCVNPKHLEPVTPRENQLRSPITHASINARETQCPKGHLYNKKNTYFKPRDNGFMRFCKQCTLEYERRRYPRMKDRINELRRKRYKNK